jgi:uncharacterized Zn-binding protein involved in type VI secretion
MPPAARVTDMHTCPMVTVLVPHVGGPILPPGCPTVLIGFLPAARIGDMAVCVGPPDVIAMGSPTVVIGNMPAARIGDLTAHGGVIVLGCPTVLIGEVGMGGGGSGAAAAMKAAKLGATAFTEMKSEAVTLEPFDVEQVSTGGAYGSQGVTLRQAKKDGTPFCEICEKMRLERLHREQL